MDLLNLKGLLLAFLIFAPLERLFALHPGQRLLRHNWQIDLFYALINSALIALGLGAIVVSATLLSPRIVPQSLKEWIVALPFWLQLPLLILVSDLGFYTVHRLFHTVPFLWRFHAIHHSIEELDWLAAYRVHPVDQISTKGASLFLVFALGFSTPAIAAYALLYQWQSLLIHSNVKIGFGPLRWCVASPQFHHWHHANHREALDKNFAGQLSFLDALFGTLHLPGSALPQRYGTDEWVPSGYVRHLLFPFLRGPARQPAAD